MSILLVRTDYSDDRAWRVAVDAATAVYEADDFDARTMKDQTILFLYLNEYNEQVRRTFRAVPQQVEPIAVNLALTNMSFFEFADSADPDGVFRDF